MSQNVRQRPVLTPTQPPRHYIPGTGLWPNIMHQYIYGLYEYSPIFIRALRLKFEQRNWPLGRRRAERRRRASERCAGQHTGGGRPSPSRPICRCNQSFWCDRNLWSAEEFICQSRREPDVRRAPITAPFSVTWSTFLDFIYINNIITWIVSCKILFCKRSNSNLLNFRFCARPWNINLFRNNGHS